MSLLLVLAGGTFAYKDKFFTLEQMRGRGVMEGLPFVWHFGMWGNLLLITPLTGVLFGVFYGQWECLPIWPIAAMFSGLVSAVMHWLWSRDSMQQAHIENQKLTDAGWMNALYMLIVLTPILLFYVSTATTPRFMFWVSVTLSVYLLFGTHIALGLLNKSWFPQKPQRKLWSWLAVVLPALAMFGRTVWLYYR